MRLQLQFASALLLVLGVLAGCGIPAAPRPPSLELPRPVDDLMAWRQGDYVYLSWTLPHTTTDGQRIRRPGLTRICRAVDEAETEFCSPVAEFPSQVSPPAETAEYRDLLPPELQREHPTGFATYAVEVMNARGRSAGLSNRVRLPLASSLPPPTDLTAEVTAEGVRLTWSGILHEHESPALSHVYRVYRRAESSDVEALVGELQLSRDARASLTDQMIEWGETYFYSVAVITRVQINGTPLEVEGEDSDPLAPYPVDVFPSRRARGSYCRILRARTFLPSSMWFGRPAPNPTWLVTMSTGIRRTSRRCALTGSLFPFPLSAMAMCGQQLPTTTPSARWICEATKAHGQFQPLKAFQSETKYSWLVCLQQQ